jgi:putative transposase
MTRNPRAFEIGGFYHVVKRAVDGQKIFKNPQDSSRFIFGLEFFSDKEHINLWSILGRSKGTRGVSDTPRVERLEKKRAQGRAPIVEIHAFALMPNHFHLILREIIPSGISLFMQRLSGYSRYFNEQYKRNGVLFESRFKAVHIKDDIQLNNAFVYVHTNPVALWEKGWKEFEVKNPKTALQKLSEFNQSSYLDYIAEPRFLFLTTKFFFDFYGNKNKCRMAIEDWVRFKAKNTGVCPEFVE